MRNFLSRRPGWITPATLLVFVLAAYAPVFNAGFIWDDNTHLTANLITRPGGLQASWLSTRQPNYWPVTWTAFWLQWQLFGLNPVGYHVTNVLIHAGNAILILAVLRGLSVPGAAFAALLYAVHPINVETVAWITQLKTLLATTFFLASVWLYLRSTSADSWNLKLLTGSAFLFFLSLLAKPIAVGWPIVILLLRWRAARRLTLRDFALAAPYFGIAFVLGCVEIFFQYQRHMEKSVLLFDNFALRLARSGWIILFYLQKLAFPVSHTHVYPKWDINTAQLVAWLPLASILVACGALLYSERAGARGCLLAFMCYLALLFPALGFLDIGFFDYSYVADHFQYIAGIAPITFVVAGSSVIWNKWNPMRRTILAVATCGLLAVLTFLQAQEYENSGTLWSVTLKRNPKATNAVAYCNLAEWHAANGELEKAVILCEQALKEFAGNPVAINNLGNTLGRIGRADQAVHLFEQASKIDSKGTKYHFNRGVALEATGRTDEAAAAYRRELEVNPGWAPAWFRLGLLSQQSGKQSEAEHAYRKAIELNPRDPKSLGHLGSALAAQGKSAEAIAAYRRAIDMEPGDWETHANLGIALLTNGDAEGAVLALQFASHLKPESNEVRRWLNKALHASGGSSEP